MRTSGGFLREYMAQAPLALAFERTLECRLLSRFEFERPMLDLGCGDGLFARVLFTEPVDTGIDPDPDELRRARRRAAYDELIQCRGDAIPKPDGFFRTVLANSVLEHIADLGPVLRETRRVLARGGRFFVTVPSERFEHYSVLAQLLAAAGLHRAAARYRRWFNRFWRHYHAYPRREWESVFTESGFEVIESREYDPRHVCLLNDALVPWAAPALFTKRLTGRWVLSPRLRRWATAPLAPVAESLLGRDAPVANGGLVFLALAKGEER